MALAGGFVTYLAIRLLGIDQRSGCGTVLPTIDRYNDLEKGNLKCSEEQEESTGDGNIQTDNKRTAEALLDLHAQRHKRLCHTTRALDVVTLNANDDGYARNGLSQDMELPTISNKNQKATVIDSPTLAKSSSTKMKHNKKRKNPNVFLCGKLPAPPKSFVL